jgi:hypothetical protein
MKKYKGVVLLKYNTTIQYFLYNIFKLRSFQELRYIIAFYLFELKGKVQKIPSEFNIDCKKCKGNFYNYNLFYQVLASHTLVLIFLWINNIGSVLLEEVFNNFKYF